MTPSEQSGRQTLLILITLVLLVSIGVTALYLMTLGPQKLNQQVVRFVLTCGLLYWLYTGSRAASVTCIILFVLGGFVSLVFLMLVLTSGQASNGALELLLPMGLLYLLFAGILLFSPNVKAFLDYQRRARS